MEKITLNKQLNELVKEYNATEADQIERLKRIFSIVKKGKGYRIVKFTSDLWVNCWDMPNRLDTKISIDRLERFIKEVDPCD